MQVSDVMSRSVELADPNMAIREAAKRMRDENIGALPVGENDRLVGMVTDRDIVARAVAENRMPSNTAVRDVMSEGIYYCFEDDSVDQASEIMGEHQVRRLAVLNRAKRLVGIVSLGDLARQEEGAADEAAKHALKEICEPTDQPRH